jgi:hypothetical protein
MTVQARLDCITGTRLATAPARGESNMAAKNTSHRSVNMEKADGDRWRSEDDTVENADRNHYVADDRDATGGISNRSLNEEIKNQEALPDRGTSQQDGRSRRNEDIERN